MSKKEIKTKFAEDVKCETGYCAISAHENHKHDEDHEHAENHKHDEDHEHDENHKHDEDHEHVSTQTCSGPNVEIGCGCGSAHGKKNSCDKDGHNHVGHRKDNHNKGAHDHDHSHDDISITTPSFLIGAALFVIGLGLEHLPLNLGIADNIMYWIVFAVLLLGYILVGKNVLLEAGHNILKGQVFDENFLMSIASLGAFAIGEWSEAVGVMIFYTVGEYMQGRAVNHSKKSISALMDIRPDSANVKTGGGIKEVPAQDVKIGDLIVVKPGEKVPLDGVVVEGSSSIDTRALTGESMPVEIKAGAEVLSGSINGQSLITIKVTKIFAESTATKIIDMVENASNKKAKTENFITTFARYYTPAVVGIAALLALAPPILGFGTFSQWIYRGLVFLVVSCPCALVISIPLGYFGGIGAASSNGILVKGGNYLEALNKLDTVVFDKTGTLTSGEFKVQEIEAQSGFSESEVLMYAAYAENSSTHPIGVSIMEKYTGDSGHSVDPSKISDITEKAGHGVSVKALGKTIIVGNERLMESEGISVTTQKDEGAIVYVAVDGEAAGYLRISDELKADSKNAIAGLKSRGINRIVMLTGDTKKVADRIGKRLGITNIKAQLLPAQKVDAVEGIIEENSKSNAENKRGKVAFVGDGINDAPVLARADVGIAMGGVGSDAAIEAADIVIMNDEPSKIPLALDIAAKTKKIVWQNIVFALGVKAIVLILAALGFATMWAAVFADVGVALIATANSVRAGRVKRHDSQSVEVPETSQELIA